MAKSDATHPRGSAERAATTPDPAAPEDTVADLVPEASDDPMIGQTPLGQYRLVRRIGQGAFGSVYLAEQLGVGRKAVIKVLRESLADSDLFNRRFRREAAVLAVLDHHHLVRLYNFGKLESGELFLAMEYGGDHTLADEIRTHGKLPAGRALHIVAQVAAALHEAHGRGVVHRDLKPENIMLSQKDGQDWVKVVDVGIAKMLDTSDIDDGQSQLTGNGSLIGTLAYFSPEQAFGVPLDGKSDVYSMGCILYEMLAGEGPYEAKSAVEFIQAHTKLSPRPLRGRGLPVGRRFESALFKRVMAKKAADRMSAQELADWAIAESKRVETQRPKRRRRTLAVAAAVALCALAAGGLWLWDSGESQVISQRIAARRLARAEAAQRRAMEEAAEQEQAAAQASALAASERAAAPAAPPEAPAPAQPPAAPAKRTFWQRLTHRNSAAHSAPASAAGSTLTPPANSAHAPQRPRALALAQGGWLDSATSLLWQKSPSPQTMSLDDAVKSCAQLPGHWRLPTLGEAADLSLFQRSRGQSLAMQDASAALWTAPGAGGRNGSTLVLSSGAEQVADKSENHRVRCVRDAAK